jgi:septum formation protein
MKIILASASPRRRQLLEQIGLKFTVLPTGADEPDLPHLHPAGAAVHIAKMKAEHAAKGVQDGIIIAADTIVAIAGRQLGKPRDAQDAAAMLRMLQGKRHAVYTGVCTLKLPEGREVCACERTWVKMAPMDDGQIRAYIATGEPMDKAGAYGIQGYGAVFIEKVEGCFFNVMGLPLRRLYGMLRELDFEATGDWPTT